MSRPSKSPTSIVRVRVCPAQPRCFPTWVLGWLLLVVLGSATVLAQQAPTSFIIVETDAVQSTLSAVPGYGENYPSGSNYTLRFGFTPGVPPGQGKNLQVATFVVGGETYRRIDTTGPLAEKPFDRVVINRVNNAAVGYAKVTAFISTAQVLSGTVANGTTVHFDPDFVETMEGLINSFIMNRGSDNLFANTNSVTLNNIERVDMILEEGITVAAGTAARTGFMLLERGGNDNFKIAAIKVLSGPGGTVTTLGPLITADHVGAGGVWGSTGRSARTTVFQSVASGSQPLLRPSQNLVEQTIHGTYISFENLGVVAGETIFGVALFPGDVTESMDLVGLTDVPQNTDGASSTTGGLDFVAGGGFFRVEDVELPDPVVTGVSAECTDTNFPRRVNLGATVANAGIVRFQYSPDGGDTWLDLVPVTGPNPRLAVPPPVSLQWDAPGSDTVFQLRVQALATYDRLAQVSISIDLDDGCTPTPTAVVMGEVELAEVTLDELLGSLGVYGMSASELLALLRVWDPAAAERLAGADLESLIQALIDSLDPDGDGVVTLLRWETLEQRGTVGFFAERRVGGDWQRINNAMLPALVAAPMGAQYWLADPGAASGTAQEYRLIELEAQGTTRLYGPFKLNPGGN